MRILSKRSGAKPTVVVLKGGRRTVAKSVAWGRDQGDKFDHVTTNSDTPGDDGECLFFFTKEVEELRDADTDQLLYPKR